MSRLHLSPLSFLVVTLALVGCGGEEPLTPADAPVEEEAPPVASTADCDPDAIVVGAGGPRVSRTASITVRHGEAPDDLQVWVSGPGGKQTGDLYANDGKTVLLPTQPYPANATMTWHVRMCGEEHTGTFRTGNLLRPVSDEVFDDAIAGTSYALDLRVGRWSAPFDDGAKRLVYALGGALLVDVVEREHGVVRLALAAAAPDNAGGYTRDASAPSQVFELAWGDNPYTFVSLDGFRLATSSGEVVLREALVGVGFDVEGLSEAFVSARLEVSDDACLLLAEVGQACAPCVEGETDGPACVDISVENLYGIRLP